MRTALTQLRGLTSTLRSSLGSVGPQMQQMTGYLSQLSTGFRRQLRRGFYLPPRTFDDPEYRRVMDMMFSPGRPGHRLLVYGDGKSWGRDGADRSAEIRVAAAEALKDTPLAVSGVVDLTGVGTATAELIEYVQHDFALLVIVTLILIFVIVAGMLRSPVAGIVVLATVTISYASALGASAAIWQFLVGQPLRLGGARTGVHRPGRRRRGLQPAAGDAIARRGRAECAPRRSGHSPEPAASSPSRGSCSD